MLHERARGTTVQERFWATRHLKEQSDWGKASSGKTGNVWVDGYWSSTSHEHRALLLERIRRYSPIEAVLEIGCNCGPNLQMIGKEYRSAKVVGIDINPAAIQAGKELLKEEGLENVSLLVGKADDLRAFDDKTFDVVFTDAVLIYIGPDKIHKVVGEMVRLARKAVIFVELHDPSGSRGLSGVGKYIRGCWIRDYEKIMRSFNLAIKGISLTKISEGDWEAPNWQEFGHIIEASL